MIHAYDPNGFLSLIDYPHIKVDHPVDRFNFIAKHDLTEINMPYLLWDGEVLEEDSPHWNDIIIREPSCLLIAHKPEKLSHRIRAFYPHHLILTVKTNTDIKGINRAKDKPFLADALLGQPRRHRWIVFNRLRESGLLDSCLVNLKNGRFETIDSIMDMARSFPGWGKPYTYETMALSYYEETAIAAWKTDPDYFDSISHYDTSGRWLSQIIPWKIYEACKISIVAETEFLSGGFFPTEKIGKCLLAGRMFFVAGSKGFLRNLRLMGFQTFSDIIDESYDDEEDYIQRTDAMMRSFVDFSKTDIDLALSKISSILDHNRSLMTTRYLTQNIHAFIDGLRA